MDWPEISSYIGGRREVEEWITVPIGSTVGLELELELVLRPTVSRPVHLGIGPLFGAHDQILSFSSFSFDSYFVVLPRAPSLRRR
jgi:hypothetical protein